MKKQRGITLIALIVTIIVLLILAGVAIGFIIGENGIIQKAEKAAEETKDAAEKETIEMADTSLKIDAYTKESNDGSSVDWTKYYTEENFNKYLGGNGIASNFVNNADGTIQFEYESNNRREN